MTPEQAAYMEKATTSLQAAKALREQRFYDYAVSRAYYAMFYAAEAMLLGEGLKYSKHSAVIAAFGQRFAKTNRVSSHLHRYLITGQDSRLLSDYDPTVRTTKATADLKIEQAGEFLEAARAFLETA
jgi:uncharacterized protein (UPF0332 family)